MEKIMNGKELSIKIKEQIKEEIKLFNSKPCLAVIQVGLDAASEVYVNSKKKTALEVGMNFQYIKYEDEITESILLEKINELNHNIDVDGILVQLPLPKHLNEKNIINAIDPSKDVDGLTDINVGKLVNNKECLVSCTPLGIMELLNEYKIDLQSKHVVIVGRSSLVGKPLISLFLNNNATVTICHSKTNNLGDFTKQADILVVAVGHKYLINSSMIKKDVIIIDVGINRVDSKLYGDVNYDDVVDAASLITPVPGGVGPMTVIMLLKNVIKSYKNKITGK